MFKKEKEGKGRGGKKRGEGRGKKRRVE